MSTIPGLFVLGEANFSDHGANRLGASALMQGLADGYFVIPYTIGNYLATTSSSKVDESTPGDSQTRQRASKRPSASCSRSTASARWTRFHRELGKIMWEYCGMARNRGRSRESIGEIRELREEFWQNVTVPGSRRRPEPEPRKGRPRRGLPRAGRVDVH